MSDWQPERKTIALNPTTQRRSINRLGLRVASGPDAGKGLQHFDEGTVTVGTASGTELTLTDPTVSHYHLELKPTADGIRITDLGSLNGTRAAGVGIRDAVVGVGAKVEVGRTVLVVEDSSTVDVDDHDPTPAIPGFVGKSAALRNVSRAIASLAESNVNVLITGETGTGKELVARAIHQMGPRREKKLVTVDCGGLPDTLLAAQLFGHESGVVAGLEKAEAGAFERADGGTLFLDEVGELPPTVQSALHGVLERRRFRRLGGAHDIEVDVRVVAATNRDLRAEANRQSFRLDLYYRLAVARLNIPPLRERPEDVPLLVEHFVREATGSIDNTPFDASMLEQLQKMQWPGNARELRNMVERTVAMGQVVFDHQPDSSTDGGAINVEDVPYRVARAKAIGRFEQTYLKALIDSCQGNASAAARKAQMDRPYLLQLLRKHGLR